jgi:DNA-binding NarL/FixJ family response regulator
MKVLLIDDHPLILSALQTVIESLNEKVQVVGVESAGEARAALTASRDFDLVLLDLQLGDADGFDVLEEFRKDYPSLPVVVVSASDRSSDVIRSIDLGAMGFVPKRTGRETLAQALSLVMAGGIFVPSMALNAGATTQASTMQQRAGAALMQSISEHASAAGFQTTAAFEGLSLTRRQTDVLALLLQGKPNKVIARELGVSVETIKDHVAAVLKALGVSSRTQAVLAVAQMSQRQGGHGFSAFRDDKP